MIQTQLKFSIIEDPSCNNPIHPWFIFNILPMHRIWFWLWSVASWEAELTLPASFGRSPGRRLGFTEHRPIGIQGSRSKTSQHWGPEKAVEGIFLSWSWLLIEASSNRRIEGDSWLRSWRIYLIVTYQHTNKLCCNAEMAQYCTHNCPIKAPSAAYLGTPFKPQPCHFGIGVWMSRQGNWCRLPNALIVTRSKRLYSRNTVHYSSNSPWNFASHLVPHKHGHSRTLETEHIINEQITQTKLQDDFFLSQMLATHSSEPPAEIGQARRGEKSNSSTSYNLHKYSIGRMLRDTVELKLDIVWRARVTLRAARAFSPTNCWFKVIWSGPAQQLSQVPEDCEVDAHLAVPERERISTNDIAAPPENS